MMADVRRSEQERFYMADHIESLDLSFLNPYVLRRIVSRISAAQLGKQVLARHPMWVRVFWLLAYLYSGNTLDVECLHAAMRCLVQGRDDVPWTALAAKCFTNQCKRAAEAVVRRPELQPNDLAALVDVEKTVRSPLVLFQHVQNKRCVYVALPENNLRIFVEDQGGVGAPHLV